jgi:vanillate O-demethylase monooxygenase subunit
MGFLRNTWYIAAWAKEIVEQELFSRMILNEPVLLYRKQDGSIAAISDRCPHRFAPLHMGKLKDDCVQCPYHGLTFGSDGKCANNPHGDGSIPKAAHVKAYPVVERHLAIWIWMGDPSLADPATIPDYAFLAEAKPHSHNTGYIYSKCNFQLLSDNIMDLSHVDYLHPTTLGGGALTRAEAKITELPDRRVRILWESRNDVAPPVTAPDIPAGALVDSFTEVVWSAPALMHLSTGWTLPGKRYDEGLTTSNLHMMTPETETTSHYFFANTRSFRQDDAEFNHMLNVVMTGVFADEDKPMVEAQQTMMQTADLWALKPVLLPIDAGAVRTRRILQRLIEEEATVASAK